MTEMVLLGAGASAEADVPISFEMTRKIVDRFKPSAIQGSEAWFRWRAVSTIIGGLLFQQGIQGSDPLHGVDVEAFMAAALSLSERSRSTNELAPFISIWHPVIDELTREYRNRTIGHPDVWVDIANITQAMLVQIATITDATKVDYLSPLLDLMATQKDECGNGRLVIATINYDNSIELLAESHGIHCHTGIEEWFDTKEFDTTGSGLYLLKLHGSIDWEQEQRDSTPHKPMPTMLVKKHQPRSVTLPMEQVPKPLHYMPAVIFGQRNKLTAEGPFLDLFQSFKRELDVSDVLTVIGYSFRDEHINAAITQWLNRRQGVCTLRIVAPHFKQSIEPYAISLRDNKYLHLDTRKAKASAGLRRLYGRLR